MLAGGRSSRMGRDKAGLPFGSETLLQVAIRKLRAVGFTVAVSGQRDEWETDGAPCLLDRIPDCGPLSGIEAGLRASPSPEMPVVFVPVDVPLLPGFFVRELAARASVEGVLAVMPRAAGREQPLCAAYSPALQPELAAALEQKERRVFMTMRRLAGAGLDSFRVEALATARGWSGSQDWFRNGNTPDEYQAMLTRI